MSPLKGRNIVLGVSGGIAAYKAVEVCRQLVKEGAHVVPVLTESSLNFVGKATWSALGSEPAKTSVFEDPDPILHTRLGQEADLVLVCPATARLIGSYAAGISSDVLTTTLIATKAPVLICPAMHTEMWEHPATQQNIQTLKDRGVNILGPFSGALAGSDVGMGRMAEPQEILIATKEIFSGGILEGVKVLIASGGTKEAIDPVRFVGNHSSGKQGIALALAAQSMGAEVELVTTNPTDANLRGIDQTQTTTAEEMFVAMLDRSPKADIVIMAAAVADYRPIDIKNSKIKRSSDPLVISLEPTPDILKELTNARNNNKGLKQIIVGFAAETENLEEEASKKLESKGIDMIVANNVSAPDVGFNYDTNEVLILGRDGSSLNVGLTSKLEVAQHVLKEAQKLLTNL